MLDGRQRKKHRRQARLRLLEARRCGHCGCALVGEIKKGTLRLLSLHRLQGRCPEPYVPKPCCRRKFSNCCDQLDIGEAALQLVSEGLLSPATRTSQGARGSDQTAAGRSTTACRRASTPCMSTSSTAKWTPASSSNCRPTGASSRTAACARSSGTNRRPALHGGRRQLLEMAQQRPTAVRQARNRCEKRRLLNFVVSNSTWEDGELNANLREPFGSIAEMAKFTSRAAVQSNGANFADHSGWLGN